jgi:Uma2 family endonuclease
MTAIIADRYLERRLISRRRRLGLDGRDEVWEGVYFMAPLGDLVHQEFGADLAAIITFCVKFDGLGRCFPGVNISDRKKGWRKNYRCPDVAVYLHGNPAEDCGKFWFGGPDFAVEIVSPQDRTRKKIPFYEKVGTRELFIVDRRPWRLTLLRLQDGKLAEIGQSTFDDPQTLSSATIPLSFRLDGTSERPAIEIAHHDGARRWRVEATK